MASGARNKMAPLIFLSAIFCQTLDPCKTCPPKIAKKKKKKKKKDFTYFRHVFNAQNTFNSLTNHEHYWVYIYKAYQKCYCFGYAKWLLIYFLHMARFCAPSRWRPGQVPPPPSYATGSIDYRTICWKYKNAISYRPI